MFEVFATTLAKGHDAEASGQLEEAERHYKAAIKILDEDEFIKAIEASVNNAKRFNPSYQSPVEERRVSVWGDLSSLYSKMKKYEEARDACYRRLRCIDEFYGRNSDVWEHPDQYIPENDCWSVTISTIASEMQRINRELGMHELSEKWSRLANFGKKEEILDVEELLARYNPDKIWQSWTSDASQPEGNWAAKASSHSPPVPESASGEDRIPTEENLKEDWLMPSTVIIGDQISYKLRRDVFGRLEQLSRTHYHAILIEAPYHSQEDYRAEHWQFSHLEKLLQESLENNDDAIYVCCIPRGDHRLFIFYCRDPGTTRRRLEELIQTGLSHRLSISSTFDPSWSRFKEWAEPYMPTPALEREKSIPEGTTLDGKAFAEIWRLTSNIEYELERVNMLLSYTSTFRPEEHAQRQFATNYFVDCSRGIGSENLQLLEEICRTLIWLDIDVARSVAAQVIHSRPMSNKFPFHIAKEFAPIDPEFALELLGKIYEPELKLDILILSAKALWTTKPDLSKLLLRQALGLYDEARDASEPVPALLAVASVLSEFDQSWCQELLDKTLTLLPQVQAPWRWSYLYDAFTLKNLAANPNLSQWGELAKSTCEEFVNGPGDEFGRGGGTVFASRAYLKMAYLAASCAPQLSIEMMLRAMALLASYDVDSDGFASEDFDSGGIYSRVDDWDNISSDALDSTASHGALIGLFAAILSRFAKRDLPEVEKLLTSAIEMILANPLKSGVERACSLIDLTGCFSKLKDTTGEQLIRLCLEAIDALMLDSDRVKLLARLAKKVSNSHPEKADELFQIAYSRACSLVKYQRIVVLSEIAGQAKRSRPQFSERLFEEAINLNAGTTDLLNRLDAYLAIGKFLILTGELKRLDSLVDEMVNLAIAIEATQAKHDELLGILSGSKSEKCLIGGMRLVTTAKVGGKSLRTFVYGFGKAPKNIWKGKRHRP